MNFFERARIGPGIRILTALLLAPLVWLPCAAGTPCPAQDPPRVPAPAILSTDLSLDRDPDDWFDALLFLTLPGIEPKGIVLEHYATNAERWTWFETDPRGPDRMMVGCDARSLCEWIVRHTRAVAEGRAIPQQ